MFVFLFDVGRSMFDVGRSSFILSGMSHNGENSGQNNNGGE
jgi:hypothetical protein